MQMKFFGKFVRGKGFAALFALFSMLSAFYVSERMGRLLDSLFSCNSKWWILTALLALMGYMLVYIKRKKEKKKTRNLYEVCSVFLCFLLYLVMLLWVYDFVDVLFQINQDSCYMIPVIGSVLITGYGFCHAKKLYIREYDIPLEHFQKEKKIALLSDIHVGTFVDIKQLRKIIAMVNKIQADMVLIAGDLFDVDAFAYCKKAEIASELQKLLPKGNVYAVLGNHDPKATTGEMRKFYKEAGIEFLVDECIETEDFVLVGRDDSTTNPDRKPLYTLLQKQNRNKPVIILDHNPTGIKEAVEQETALIVCGHTHKGQFFPADVFTKLAYGKQGFYGYFREEKTQSVVSSGAGYFQMPMRIGSNSEIVVLHVQGK